MASIKEIAELAGVSNATVSRVLNYDNSLSITDDKKKMIFEIAESLNYKPPRQRKLESKVHRPITLGLVHWYGISEELLDVYYLSIRLGIEKECIQQQIEVVKIFREEHEMMGHKLKQVDAIIAVGKFTPDEIDQMRRINEHIVFVDSSPEEILYDSVVIDFRASMRTVLNYLIDTKGYTDIGYIGGRDYIGQEQMALGERREQFFKEYLASQGMLKEENVYVGRFLPESGYELMKKAISDDHLPRAFFIASDTMAIGAMRALHEAGIKIPDEVGIIGFNDIPNAIYLVPPLSTVKVYTEFMGETAVVMAKERILGREIAKKSIIPTQLILRESI